MFDDPGLDAWQKRAMMRALKHSSQAPVAELVDARDSKSRFLWKCRFDSDRGHHLIFTA